MSDHPTSDQPVLDRWTHLAFAAALVGIFGFLLYVGRDQWFYLDEWQLLSERPLGADSLLRSHNGHWVLLPVLVYRVNFALFGLREYLPYQIPVVLTHLGIVVLLRQVMLRCGVRAWIATAAALVFALFGSGSRNIIWGFQISLDGSLLLGLGYLLLVEDGERAQWSRRDWIGLAVGLCCLATSNVAVVMIAVVGLTLLIRRGIAIAARHTLPLGAIFAIWYLAYGVDESERNGTDASGTLAYVWRMIVSGFDHLGQFAPVAVALAAVALLGAVRLADDARSSEWRALSAGTLAIGAVGFAATVAISRGGVSLGEGAASSRYLHVTIAMLLPLIGLGAEAVARQWRPLAIVPVALLTIGVPGNIDAFFHRSPFSLGEPRRVAALAHSPFIDETPEGVRPLYSGIFSPFSPTTGWLRGSAEAGDIPDDTSLTPQERLDFSRPLIIRQSSNDVACTPQPNLGPLEVDPGDEIAFDGNIAVTITAANVTARPFRYLADAGRTIEILAGPVELEIQRVASEEPARLCVVDGA